MPEPTLTQTATISLEVLHLFNDMGLRDPHVRVLLALECLGASRPEGYTDIGTLHSITCRGPEALEDIVSDLERWQVIYREQANESTRYWLACPLTDYETLRSLLAPGLNSEGRLRRFAGERLRRKHAPTPSR